MSILTLLDFVNPTTGCAWLDRSDIDAVMGPQKVDQLANDDGTGRVDSNLLNTIMAKAEQKTCSILLRAFTAQEIVAIMQQDQYSRSCSADIAAEFLTRRKADFSSDDGKGRYYTGYKEALEHFEKMSHGRTETAAEVVNAQQGGNARPPIQYPEQPYIFAPDTRFRGPGGRGGF
jgi:hypothetical protein